MKLDTTFERPGDRRVTKMFQRLFGTRNTLRAATFFVCAITLGARECAFAEATRPNVLFILADDLGWRDVGCYGSTFYETPSIDGLAAAGARFTNAYAACPVCSPTRASILTGKYPARLNTTDWFGAPQPDSVENHWTRDKPLLPARYVDRLPLGEVTLAEALKQAGYRTFFAGKWHLGGAGYLPEDQGFDVNRGGHHRGSPPGGYFSPYRNPRLGDGPVGEHLPARLADETIQFIRDQQDEPFFAMLSFYSVHTPLQAPDDLVARYERKRARGDTDRTLWGREGDRKVRLVQDHAVYAAMVEAMDSAVGRVLQALEDLDIDDDTIVVFTSDNGGLSTSEGHPTSNVPLRAGKGWLYEGGIRVPAIIRWPGTVPGDTVIDRAMISTDYYPTLLDMIGLPPLPDQHADGVSLASRLRGEPTEEEDRAIFWHYPHYGNQGGSPSAAIRRGPYKLIEFFEDDRVELYRLDEDVGESVDVSAALPDRARALRSELRAWQESVGARFPTANERSRRATKTPG